MKPMLGWAIISERAVRVTVLQFLREGLHTMAVCAYEDYVPVLLARLVNRQKGVCLTTVHFRQLVLDEIPATDTELADYVTARRALDGTTNN